MKRWQIEPLKLKPVDHGIAKEFANRLLSKGLLPSAEFNDGLNLAETALAEIPMLVTSDHHLLDMDEASLTIVCDDAGLSHVYPCHPLKLYGALR